MKFFVSLRPLHWAVMYFVQIILFTFFYSLHAHSFYHSTASLEPSMAEDRITISNAIRDYVRENGETIGLDEYFGGDYPYEVSISWDADTGTKLTIHDAFLGFRSVAGKLSLAHGADGWEIWGRFHDTPEIAELYDKTGYPPWALLNVPPSYNLVSAILGWQAANRGSPARTTDLYMRMLYLSVVTTTTLGYGDIVPLTNETRLAVALQSILGIIIAAGFVQALLSRDRTVNS